MTAYSLSVKNKGLDQAVDDTTEAGKSPGRKQKNTHYNECDDVDYGDDHDVHDDDDDDDALDDGDHDADDDVIDDDAEADDVALEDDDAHDDPHDDDEDVNHYDAGDDAHDADEDIQGDGDDESDDDDAQSHDDDENDEDYVDEDVPRRRKSLLNNCYHHNISDDGSTNEAHGAISDEDEAADKGLGDGTTPRRIVTSATTDESQSDEKTNIEAFALRRLASSISSQSSSNGATTADLKSGVNFECAAAGNLNFGRSKYSGEPNEPKTQKKMLTNCVLPWGLQKLIGKKGTSLTEEKNKN